MAKKESSSSSVIAGYKIVNKEKLARAKKAAGADASEELILAYYDKLAGAILDEDGDKLKTGKFWNFGERKPKGVKKEDEEEGAKRKGQPKK